MSVTIQPASVDDLPEIVALEASCYPDPWPPESFLPLVGNPRVFFVTARQPGKEKVSGYTVAWFVVDEGELANLAVSPDARRRGVGGALLDAVLDEAVRRGTKQLYLEVRASNSAALALYESRKFRAVGRRKGYYRNPVEDALLLCHSVRSTSSDT